MSQTLSALSIGHIDEISSSKNEPDWLKEYRKNSLSKYQSLPIETSPLYNKYTDAKKMDPQQVSLSVSTAQTIPPVLQRREELTSSLLITTSLARYLGGFPIKPYDALAKRW